MPARVPGDIESQLAFHPRYTPGRAETTTVAPPEAPPAVVQSSKSGFPGADEQIPTLGKTGKADWLTLRAAKLDK